MEPALAVPVPSLAMAQDSQFTKEESVTVSSAASSEHSIYKTGEGFPRKLAKYSFAKSKRSKLFWWLTGTTLVIMIALALTLGLVLGLAGKSHAANIDLTVDLGYSKYQGQNENNGVSHWWGIRYAAPPVGDLRFRAPQDPAVDTTLQQANTHSKVCRSSPSTSADPDHSEDCLFLDVYAPTSSDSAKPVFVWFSGGGFNTISDPNKNGAKLVQASNSGMVVVTFNYRVGPYGFIASKEVQANGDLNNGLKDQRKVLEWIQKYIHLFGGDPKHVTIGGASAGGASVDLHLSAYGGRDDGLFHAAAAESQSFGAQLTVAESQYQYDALVKRVGCDTAPDTLKCLRSADIADNNPNVPTPGGSGGDPVFMWSNVIDGNFTPDYTYKLFDQGKFVKVPVIFGDVSNEGTLFTPQGATNFQNYDDVNAFLKNNYVQLNAAQLAQIDHFYPKAEQFPGQGPYWRTAANAYGEMRYNCPGIFVSYSYPRYGVSQSWNYHWDYLPDGANAALGVQHTAESGSVWGTTDTPLNTAIQSYWMSFIMNKDPNQFKVNGAPANLPTWGTFSQGSMQRILFNNKGVSMENVDATQQVRCAYLTAIGGDVRQ
ncbi:Lipase [Lachnellula suecica]|uniref:Carboxylic ester hydrolase n=1 Tax=Lachnellula suecica TaxID=602035 RepID=A0A8T9C0U7_9HELO|nr:Lipase [Lachnellula suecica]